MDEDLRELVSELGNRASRTAAGATLLAAGSPGIAALRAGLAHPDLEVRRFAARALDHVPLDNETFESLVALIRTETIPKVRSAAVHVLACEGCKPGECSLEVDVVGVLIDVLLHDPSADVRRQTIEGILRAAHEERSIAALRSALTDRSKKVRFKASWAFPERRGVP